MLCCGLGALLIATASLWWRRLKTIFGEPKFAQSALTVVMIGASVAVSALVAQHLGHYVERAQANERTLLAEIMAQPICSGASPGARATRIATAAAANTVSHSQPR